MSFHNLAVYIKKNMTVCAVIFISICALYLRIVHLAGHALWSDELMQIKMAKMSFLGILKLFGELRCYAYIECADILLTHPFAMMFDHNKWGLAIPHIILTILGLYFLYLICRDYFKTTLGYIITFVIVCFNATLLKHATEIRVYAVLPTLALAVFYFSRQLTEQVDMSLKKRLAFGIFFVGVIWFHPYCIAMVLSCFLYFVGTKLHTPEFRSVYRRFAVFLLIVLCVAMPLWLYCVLRFCGPYNVTSSTFAFIPNPIMDTMGFFKIVLCNLVGNRYLYILIIGAFFPFIIPYADRYKQIGFLCINIIIPIQLILLSDVRSNYWFVQRQFIWVMPLFAFFLGWTWDSVFAQLKRSAAA